MGDDPEYQNSISNYPPECFWLQEKTIPVIPERYDQPSLPCTLDVRKSGKWGKPGGRGQGYSSELITFPSPGVDDDPHQKED